MELWKRKSHDHILLEPLRKMLLTRVPCLTPQSSPALPKERVFGINLALGLEVNSSSTQHQWIFKPDWLCTLFLTAEICFVPSHLVICSLSASLQAEFLFGWQLLPVLHGDERFALSPQRGLSSLSPCGNLWIQRFLDALSLCSNHPWDTAFLSTKPRWCWQFA